MMKKVGIIKRVLCISLVFLLNINALAAVVSDNDGSAFITKAEFDSLKNNFQSQIDQYNQSIDSKIDGAIAQYLAGIKISNTRQARILLNDKSKVLSIGTGNFPKYEPDDFMFISNAGGYLAVNDERTQGDTSRMKLAIYKGFQFKGHSDSWNNPKFKKIAIRNVSSSDHIAEYVDYYQNCAEKVVLGISVKEQAPINMLSGIEDRTQDYMSWSNWAGTTQVEGNWDLTINPQITAYGRRYDETKALLVFGDEMYGNWSISSVETKWTNPVDYYINVYKPIEHRAWSNYDYNCSLAGNNWWIKKSGWELDQYVLDKFFMYAAPADPGTTKLETPLDDPRELTINNHYKNSFVESTANATLNMLSYRDITSGAKFGHHKSSIQGAACYGLSATSAAQKTLFALGWDNRVNNWDHLWFQPYDKFVSWYQAHPFTNSSNVILLGKDSNYHISLAAGFPLVEVTKNEIISYNFKIQEAGTYILFVKNDPFVSTDPSSEDGAGISALKNISSGSTSGSNRIILTGGGVNNIVEFTAAKDGYIWIKWAESLSPVSNCDGKGTLLLEPTATITEPES